MKPKCLLFVLASLVFTMSGCGDDDTPTNPSKDDPPEAVGDLAVVAFDDSTITLTWTTPDDPSKMMSVGAYDLRFSETAITAENWADADTVQGEPVPGEASMADTFRVGGLEFFTTYHFALRSSDDKGQWSGLSNVVSASTDSIDSRLIAYYPLVSDADDVTGNNDPMTLINTPFQDGGIYCNGVYIYDGRPDSSDAVTPDMPRFNFSSFTICARFKVNEFNPVGFNPVFTGGDMTRWIGLTLSPDSTVSLMYSNGATVAGTEEYTLDTWHEAVITYDGTAARLYLDGVEAAEKTLELTHSNDRNVGVSNLSNGTTFKGVFGRLKIYSGVVAP